jgi:hypothetical protein
MSDETKHVTPGAPRSLSDKPFPLDPRGPPPIHFAQVGVIQDDIAAILRALGLGDHARPTSPHLVVLDEIIPTILRRQQMAHRLTMLALQSNRYADDVEYKDAVDDVLLFSFPKSRP